VNFLISYLYSHTVLAGMFNHVSLLEFGGGGMGVYVDDSLY